MATKADLKQQIRDNGYIIVSDTEVKRYTKEDDTEIIEWQIGTFEVANEVVSKKTFTLYEDVSSTNAYWKDKDPFVLTFREEVLDYISSKIADGTITSGFAQRIEENSERATVKVTFPDKSIGWFLLRMESGGIIHEKL